MSNSDLMVCDNCKRTVYKPDTLIIDTPKWGKLRLCRDCQYAYYLKEIDEKTPGLDVRLKEMGAEKGLKDLGITPDDIAESTKRSFKQIKEGK